jgi:hypothetical protein
MALLPKIPWTDIDDTRVAVDAPVSTDLWTDTVIDLNYLKATLTDGALAPQTINCALIISTGETINGDLQVNGNATVTGTLSVGVFFSSEQLLFLTAL